MDCPYTNDNKKHRIEKQYNYQYVMVEKKIYDFLDFPDFQLRFALMLGKTKLAPLGATLARKR